MGLLSGGQILNKKRNIFSRGAKDTLEGNEVTHFDEKIADLKKRMRSLYDEIGENLDEETRDKLIQDSWIVFHKNNEIVRTVKNVNRVTLQKMAIVIGVIGIAIYLCKRMC